MGPHGADARGAVRLAGAVVTCRWGCFEFAADDPDCRAYGLGAAALRYAWWGYSVLPLARAGKRPHRIVPHGVREASRDPLIIASWWRQDRGANIGVATGSVSRLAVVDLDVKHGVNGIDSMERFLAGPPPMPRDDILTLEAAPRVLTPSGGLHLWLRTPTGVVVPERPGILPGVDVKGDGGYAVCAPSMLAVVPGDRSGGGTGEVPVPYEWALGCPHEAPPWPGWMAGWLARGAVRTGAVSHAGGAGRDRGGKSAGEEALDEDLMAVEGLSAGTRNHTMYRLACSLYRRLGTSPGEAGEVLARLREVWEKTDRTDFPWSEALVCAESARRFIERSRAEEDERNAAFLAWLRRR